MITWGEQGQGDLHRCMACVAENKDYLNGDYSNGAYVLYTVSQLAKHRVAEHGARQPGEQTDPFNLVDATNHYLDPPRRPWWRKPSIWGGRRHG